jgi:putative SOS response-associated peptidase YedK
MCGRFTLKTPPLQLAEALDLMVAPDWEPRWNIAPSQSVGVVRQMAAGGQRQWDSLRWGLVPHWAKDTAMGNAQINARSESAATKPTFRTPFRQRRCLIPADGFYEWKQIGGKRKQAFYIHREDKKPFAFAGLWDRWADPSSGKVIESCTILTTEAAENLAPLHHRMPVILPANEFAGWLDPRQENLESLQAILATAQAEELRYYPVGNQVNKPAHDAADCIDRVDEMADSPPKSKPQQRQIELF